jgi:hypothetical protein
VRCDRCVCALKFCSHANPHPLAHTHIAAHSSLHHLSLFACNHHRLLSSLLQGLTAHCLVTPHPPTHPHIHTHTQEEKEALPDLGVLKNVMAHNWVEPSKRERKRVLNYNEADYFKQVCCCENRFL